MRQILTYEQALSVAFGIWLAWKILQDTIRFSWEWVLYRRWRRRAWPRRTKESES